MGGDIPHAGDSTPRNFLMSVPQFLREVLHQFADVDKRHANGPGGSFIAKEILGRDALQQITGDGDFRKNLFDDLAVSAVHRT